MTSLTGKITIVTGASGGLGSAVVPAFERAGAIVIPADRPAHDLSTAAGAGHLIESVLAEHGRVDIAVHLIGGYTGGASIAETDDATFDKMILLNLRTAFNLFRAALQPMRAQGGGRLLAIGSRAAVESAPASGVYAASKAALVSLIRTIAAENKDRGITANIVLPGTMDTPGNRAAMPSADPVLWVRPAHVAAMLVNLAAESGAGVNGAVIPIYGGDA